MKQMPIKPALRAALGLAVMMLTSLPVAAEEEAADDPSAPLPACVVSRTTPIFAAFEDRRAEWEAQYQRRRAEFHPRMMEHANELGRCVERALRRDLAPNSQTTFGVHVAPGGQVAHVAMLDSNHANNLYGNCLARSLCKIELSAGSAAAPEIFVFQFNMRRKTAPNQRPWSLDPRP